MKKITLSLLAVGLIGTAAHAQAPATWSGFKAGLSLGAANYTSTWTDTGFDWFGGSLSYSNRKLVPSVHVGWDIQTGSVVYGAELDHAFVSSKRDVRYDGGLNPANPSIRIHNELKSVTTLRGRMGVTVGDGLVYATAGLAKASANHTWTGTNNSPDNFSTNNDHTGFVYGFGVEHRVNQLLSLRAEYQHTNFPEASAYNSPTATYPTVMEVGDNLSTFNFGASFHF
ncbi:MAG TPA: outer membrane beta-barrel protein [Holophagaceae bacterium]|jgi:opacity protein-like surface antigen|nr:outer membrane beta-barrel protein [Holophagaceae bacterium]